MQDLNLYSEKELLERVAGGDERAFRQIYDRYYKRIAAFVFLLTGSVNMADDIVQEVFIKLWLNRHKLTGVVYFNSWLHTITRNLAVDAMKKTAKETVARETLTDILAMADHPADEFIFSKENERLLQQALSRLSPQQQMIYKLSRQEGLKHAEIASRLNISGKTVKNHLVNALRIIRAYFLQHAELIIMVPLLLSLS